MIDWWKHIDFKHPEFDGIERIELKRTVNGEQTWIEARWFKNNEMVRQDQLGIMPPFDLIAKQGE